VIRVKICGLNNVKQALEATKYGADYIGLVFAPSSRQITQENAVQISRALSSQKSRPAIVGVFVNLPAKQVNLISELCRLDYVQLSGDETFTYCRDIKLPVIKTIRVSASAVAHEIIRVIQEGNRILSDRKITYLLDTQNRRAYGGTGQVFNWQVAKEVSSLFPVIIAGGLTLNNVGLLIEEVKPWGVDVSSGVETEGKKDLIKIRNFIKIIKSDCEDE
jgi:phosphoribosylanthranilate isomerase